MAILQNHIPFYEEIFALPDFFQEPVALFGFQDVRVKDIDFERWSQVPPRRWARKASLALRRRRRYWLGRGPRPLPVPADYEADDLVALLHKRGVSEVRVFDLFDPRADCHYDMNLPVPAEEHERYGTFILFRRRGLRGHRAKTPFFP